MGYGRDVELQIGFIFQSLKDELVLCRSEAEDIHKISIDPETQLDLRLPHIEMDIRAPERKGSQGDEHECLLGILSRIKDTLDFALQYEEFLGFEGIRLSC